jgi:hypothetical protein
MGSQASTTVRVKGVKLSRDRLKQVEVWLRNNFPISRSVKIRVEKFGGEREGECGECCRYPGNKTLYIKINRICTQEEANETLLHEWAHILVWPPTAKKEKLAKEKYVEHTPKWGIAFAKILHEWYDKEGHLKSESLEIK